MIKTEIIFPKDFPEFKMIDALAKIAEEIIVPTLKKTIDREEDIDGQRYGPLAESTLRIKRAKGQSPMVLHQENVLANSFISFIKDANTVVITIAPQRLKVGRILQSEGVKTKSGRRFFKFFGVNETMEKRAVNLMREEIAKKIKDA